MIRPDGHVIVLFGATGDLAKRKLLPGLFHLARAASPRQLPHHRLDSGTIGAPRRRVPRTRTRRGDRLRAVRAVRAGVAGLRGLAVFRRSRPAGSRPADRCRADSRGLPRRVPTPTVPTCRSAFRVRIHHRNARRHRPGGERESDRGEALRHRSHFRTSTQRRTPCRAATGRASPRSWPRPTLNACRAGSTIVGAAEARWCGAGRHRAGVRLDAGVPGVAANPAMGGIPVRRRQGPISRRWP